MKRKILGKKGEDLAESFLRAHKYKILAKNYRCPVGEIDIITRDGEIIAFVEIKGKRSRRFGSSLEAVTAEKQARIARVAAHYLAAFRLQKFRTRFDVIGIQWIREDKPEVTLIKDAFRLPR